MNMHKNTRLTPHHRQAIWLAYTQGKESVTSLARRYQVSRVTIYRALKAARGRLLKPQTSTNNRFKQAKYGMKRLSQLPAGRANGLMSIAATLSLGPREQIAVVKVGERAMLVGITSQSIQLLTELDARELPAPSDLPQPAGQGFGSLLAGLQKKNTP